MEFEGVPRRFDPSSLRVTHKNASDPYPDSPPQGVISLSAGDKRVGYLTWSIEDHRCDIGRVWLTEQARGWGLGAKLYQELTDLMKTKYGKVVRNISGDIHTQEALKARFGKPNGMEAVYGDRFPSNAKGVQEAHELLWPASKAFPKENMDPAGPYVSVTHDLQSRRDFGPMDLKKLKTLWERQKDVSARAEGAGQFRAADNLDAAMRRVAQTQQHLQAPVTSTQMTNFMDAINQLSTLITKHEQRLTQAEAKLTQLQESLGGSSSNHENTIQDGNLDITAPPGTNVNLTANSPNETNAEINL